MKLLGDTLATFLRQEAKSLFSLGSLLGLVLRMCMDVDGTRSEELRSGGTGRGVGVLRKGATGLGQWCMGIFDWVQGAQSSRPGQKQGKVSNAGWSHQTGAECIWRTKNLKKPIHEEV